MSKCAVRICQRKRCTDTGRGHPRQTWISEATPNQGWVPAAWKLGCFLGWEWNPFSRRWWKAREFLRLGTATRTCRPASTWRRWLNTWQVLGKKSRQHVISTRHHHHVIGITSSAHVMRELIKHYQRHRRHCQIHIILETTVRRSEIL